MALLTALAYLPGLGGPFLFDDPPNLITPFSAWLDGDIGWREIIFGNGSGLFGRPLSMLSFWPMRPSAASIRCRSRPPTWPSTCSAAG